MKPGALVIATSYRGTKPETAMITQGYAESVRVVMRDLGAEILPASITFATEQCRARNRCAAMALRDYPEMTHVLFWDDDQWPEDAGIILGMVASGEHVLCAPYTNKSLPLRWTHQNLDPMPPARGAVQDVRSVGMGFTLISRHALELVSRRARKYTDRPSMHKVADVFGLLYESPVIGETCPEDEEALLSEDYSFCKRWRDAGGRVALYLPAGIMYHAGVHAFSARQMPGAILPG